MADWYSKLMSFAIHEMGVYECQYSQLCYSYMRGLASQNDENYRYLYYDLVRTVRIQFMLVKIQVTNILMLVAFLRWKYELCSTGKGSVENRSQTISTLRWLTVTQVLLVVIQSPDVLVLVDFLRWKSRGVSKNLWSMGKGTCLLFDRGKRLESEFRNSHSKSSSVVYLITHLNVHVLTVMD